MLHQPTNDPSDPKTWASRLAPLVPMLLAWFAFSGSLDGGLVFDDKHVLGPGSAMAAGAWWEAVFGAAHTSLANRPLAAFSLSALRFGDSDAVAYRWGSLLFHLGNCWLLFAVVRRCCLSPVAAAWLRPRAAGFALAVATLWACHPLTVDAVAYPTQRSMLLMGTSFLAAMYCVQRDALSPGFTGWKALAVAATAAGMCSKEEFVAAPILLILFEKTFLAAGPKELRGRRTFHGLLCATWLVLTACVLGGPHNPTVGFSALAGVGPFEWLYTQSFVIVHYLSNVLWPFTLRGAYDQGVVASFTEAIVPVLGLFGLAIVVASQWTRRPWLAWLGTAFFLLLGPTSSFFPIVTEPVADRRMYLPMLTVLVPVALLVVRLLSRWSWPWRVHGLPAFGLLAALAGVAIVATRAHAARYHDPLSFWSAAYRDNALDNRSLPTSLILCAYSEVLQEQGKEAEALEVIRKAMDCPSRLDQVPLKYAELLWNRGELVECERVLRDLAKRRPGNAKCRANLASVLLGQHERDRELGKATATDPRLVEARESAMAAHAVRKNPADLGLAGLALKWMGKLDEAEAALVQALRQGSRDPGTPRALCALLVDRGRLDGAAEIAEKMGGLRAADVPLLVRVMNALSSSGKHDRAVAVARRILSVDPGNAAARTIAQGQGGR